MTISVGDSVPAATFRMLTADGPAEMSSDELFKGKKVVVFAVPGAFTPTCSAKHLPGFIEHAGSIKGKGVDTIACVSVNDMIVMQEWGKQQGAGDDILMLSDGNAEFTTAAGLDFDGSGFGLGTRSKRYAMIVEDGKVTHLSVENAPPEMNVSGAEHVLAAL